MTIFLRRNRNNWNKEVVVVKKSEKMIKNLIKWIKSPKKNFLNRKRGVFDQKLHEESEKNGPNALQISFFEKIGLFSRILCFPPIAYSRESNLSVKELEHFPPCHFFRITPKYI